MNELKEAIHDFRMEHSKFNFIKVLEQLRNSWVWIPCNLIMSDRDRDAWDKRVKAAAEQGNVESLVGETFTNHDDIRMVPDILKNGDELFFPVFTDLKEMGGYGTQFSNIERHFMDAMVQAYNNENNVAGIVVNAFSESIIIRREMFELFWDKECTS